MKTLIALLITLNAGFAVAADDSNSTVSGSVWLTNNGQLKVLWDGVTLQGGAVGNNGGKLPSIVVDMKQVLGENALDSLNLTVSPGGYDYDAQRGSADTQIGTISLSLGEKMISNRNWDLTLSESLNATPYFHRKFLATGAEYQGTPVNIAISSQLIRHFSNGVAVSLAAGVYDGICRSLTNGDVSQSQGENIGAEVSYGRFAVGVSTQLGQLEPAHSSAVLHDYDDTAYVRYTMSKTEGHEDSVTLSVSDFSDETIPFADGTPHSGLKVGVNFSVKF